MKMNTGIIAASVLGALGLTAVIMLTQDSGDLSPAPGYPTFAVRPLAGETIPGLPPVTGRIHVDQFGYLPRADKVAIISDPQRGFNAHESFTPSAELEVRRRDDGDVVFRAVPEVWNNGEVHDDTGDRGWWFDFSNLTEPGEYYVYDPDSGLRSPVFRIDRDVYREVLVAAVRTYFYQRLAFPLEEPYAEEPWTEPAAMLQDRQTRAIWDPENESLWRDLSGGWMDAGDTNKYPPFNEQVMHSLLYTYRHYPDIFTDDFGIPESGNGLPDLLDEVKFNLDWLMKMQDEDGGVFVKMGEIDYSGPWPIWQDERPRHYGPKCTGATIISAGIYAHAARVYGEFLEWEEYAAQLREQALKGWDYYISNPRTYDSDDGTIKSGNASRDADNQDLAEVKAAVHLFALTGEERFNEAIFAKIDAPRQMHEDIWSPYGAGAGESLAEYITLPGANQDVVARIEREIEQTLMHERWNPPIETDLYRSWMNPEAYHWGSNFVRAAFGYSALYLAHFGEVNAETESILRRRARNLLHYFHGKNPLSAVMLTNMERHGAENSMRSIWHARYLYSSPFARNTPPGYVVGGPNQNFTGENSDQLPGDIMWVHDQPRGKAYADWNQPWPQNSWEITENAIYYQAAYIRLLAAFVSQEE